VAGLAAAALIGIKSALAGGLRKPGVSGRGTILYHDPWFSEGPGQGNHETVSGARTGRAPRRPLAGAVFFASLRDWRLSWLPHDLAAGLLLTAIAVPEQVATARLAGMPAEAGLIAFVAATAGFILLGRNRFLSVGADSTIAPIFAGGLAAFVAFGAAEYQILVTILALMVGAILLLAAALKAGWIADLLSIPVTNGFLAGIAVHIAVGELAPLLGSAA
jgi:MFS superfamily sulfate permease-like transporter